MVPAQRCRDGRCSLAEGCFYLLVLLLCFVFQPGYLCAHELCFIPRFHRFSPHVNKFHILLFPVHFFPRAPSSLVRGLVAVAALRLLTRLSFPTRACRPVLVSIFDLAGCIAIAHTVNVKDGPVCRQQACWSCPKIVFAAFSVSCIGRKALSPQQPLWSFLCPPP